jgi:chromosome segregation ATPase
MNDFETLRQAGQYVQVDGVLDDEEFHNALDRIETEMEKKAVMAQSAIHSVQVLEAEVERLIQEREMALNEPSRLLAMCQEQNRTMSRNIEHLQEKRDELQRLLDEALDARATAEAEVERLQEQLDVLRKVEWQEHQAIDIARNALTEEKE